jgi:hypothetical protein
MGVGLGPLKARHRTARQASTINFWWKVLSALVKPAQAAIYLIAAMSGGKYAQFTNSFRRGRNIDKVMP